MTLVRRGLYAAANFLGGVVIVLLLIDSTRPLGPVLILLLFAVVLCLVPRFLPPDK